MRKMKKKLGKGSSQSSTGCLVKLTHLFPEVKRLLQDSVYCSLEVYNTAMGSAALTGEDNGAYAWYVVCGLWAEFMAVQTGQELVTVVDDEIIINPLFTQSLSVRSSYHITYQMRMPLPAGYEYQLMGTSVLDPATQKWVWIVEMM